MSGVSSKKNRVKRKRVLINSLPFFLFCKIKKLIFGEKGEFEDGKTIKC